MPASCPSCTKPPAPSHPNLAGFAAALETQHAGSEQVFQVPDDQSVMPAVYSFLMVHREWTVTERANGRLTLSRRDEDKTRPPGAIVKALNLARAAATHALAGAKETMPEVWEARMNACAVCPHRYFDICGHCGCPCAAKASWAEQQCPDNPPRWPA